MARFLTRALPYVLLGILAVAAGAVALQAGLQAQADNDRAQRLAATGLTGYLPEIPGSEVERVELVDGDVVVHYDTAGSPYLSVRLVPTPNDLCSLLQDVDSCDVEGEVATGSFEEMSSVAVAREETTLVVNGVVTETPSLGISDVVTAFRTATPRSWQEMARR